MKNPHVITDEQSGVCACGSYEFGSVGCSDIIKAADAVLGASMVRQDEDAMLLANIIKTLVVDCG